MTQTPTPPDEQTPQEGRSGTRKDVEPRDPAASMSLLLDAMRNPLDPAYAAAAERRPPESASANRRRALRSPLVLGAVVILGLLFALTARTLHVPQSVSSGRRAQLIEQIKDSQHDNAQLSAEVTHLRESVNADQQRALSRSSAGDLSRSLSKAQALAGVSASRGEGLRVTLNNPSASAASADSDPRTVNGTATAITSTDVQTVVNGLWLSGASGIMINGQRLTSLSAIRFAGSAILVNYQPLTPPYVVTAIGPKNLRDRFSSASVEGYLTSLRHSGLSVAVDDVDDVTLPPFTLTGLTYAQAVHH